MPLDIRESPASSILTKTSGFIAEAGFTHSLTPARNCTFGCSYCYVPTMRFQGGLKPEDWQHWGRFTTFKSNAAELLAKAMRPDQRIYCSPLVDPYQPAELERRVMPTILEAVADRPPGVFVVQTRGPAVLRDIAILQRIAARTRLRVSFSIPSNRDDVLRWFEPHCPSFSERLAVLRSLRAAGMEAHATIAPILPCDPTELIEAVVDATGGAALIGDPLHVRAVKRHGATTREGALKICETRGFEEYLDPTFQSAMVERMSVEAIRRGTQFVAGPAGFGVLALG